MKSDVIRFKDSATEIEKALDAALASARYRALGEKDAGLLRLLTEEELGMARQIVGKADAAFWVESEERAFQLHLAVSCTVTGEMRKELLKVATSGKNEAAKGFTGKLRDLFSRVFTADNEMGPEDYYTQGLILPEGAYGIDVSMYTMSAEVLTWSMQKYKTSLETGKGASKEKWDELEKSVVARFADEVRISIAGDKVEMIVFKEFPGEN